MDALRNFIEGMDPVWQWLGVILISAIPTIESDAGSFIGVLAGVSLFVAIPAAVIGNVSSMLFAVFAADKIRFFAKKKNGTLESTPKSQERARRLFDKWGVPGVSLFGSWFFLPNQLTSGLMVGFGASQKKVILWQVISIVVWAIVFGLFAHWFTGFAFNTEITVSMD